MYKTFLELRKAITMSSLCARQEKPLLHIFSGPHNKDVNPEDGNILRYMHIDAGRRSAEGLQHPHTSNTSTARKKV